MTDAGVTVGLLGDVMLGRMVAGRLEHEPPGVVWSEGVAEHLRSCDAVICNLECCISDRGRETRRIRGKPFFFRAPPQAVESLATVRIAGVSLANNHALDFETEALEDALDLLGAAGVAVTGAGRSVESARRGAVIEVGDTKLGLLGVTDHPAEYAAGDDSAGVAWAELHGALPAWIEGELRRLRAEADLVVAFPHWGANMTTGPTHWQKQRARELIAAGADLVAGHSAHLFHGVERVEGRLVLYDLGDALDDYRIDPVLRNDLGVLALWRPGAEPELELVGLHLDYCETELAHGREADWIAVRLGQACRQLGTRVERLGEQWFAII